MKRTAELLLWCALVAFVGYGVGSCGTVSASEAAKREARAQEQGYRLAIAYMQERGAKVDTVTRYVTTRVGRADTAMRALAAEAEANRAALADSTATLADLRERLRQTNASIEWGVNTVTELRVSVDSLILAHLAYREATEAAFVAADSTIAAWQAAVEAERREGRRKFWRGVAVGAALILLL